MVKHARTPGILKYNQLRIGWQKKFYRDQTFWCFSKNVIFILLEKAKKYFSNNVCMLWKYCHRLVKNKFCYCRVKNSNFNKKIHCWKVFWDLLMSLKEEKNFYKRFLFCNIMFMDKLCLYMFTFHVNYLKTGCF